MAKESLKLTTPELTLLDRQCRSNLTTARLKVLASNLKLSDHTLLAFGVGWHSEKVAFSFPMFDPDGRIVGLRLRRPNGYKFCVDGSRSGLLMPECLKLADAVINSVDTLLITESESDACAVTDLGFACIARPGCEAIAQMVVQYVTRLHPSRVILIGDADTAGQRGGYTLGRLLARAGLTVRLFTPPGAKDLRSWMALPENDHHALAGLMDRPAEMEVKS